MLKNRFNNAVREVSTRIQNNAYLEYVQSIRDPDLESTILIEIAAYKDPNLLDTIRGAVAQAAAAHRIHFSICLQDEIAQAHILDGIPNMRSMFVREEDADGPCVARRACQDMYAGEDYVMHTDAHMRFARFWDVALIQNWKECRDGRGFLTEYSLGWGDLWDEPAGSDVHTARADYGHPIRIGCKGFWRNGMVYTFPRSIITYDVHTIPPRVFWASAHMSFMPGYIDQAVRFDPKMYFYGDEQPMSARYFTHGFNAYAPTASCIFHMYRNKPIPEKNRTSGLPAPKIDADSGTVRRAEEVRRIKQLYGLHDYGYPDLAVGGEYGLGTVRTFKEYEEFCGLDFANRSVRVFSHEANFDTGLEADALQYFNYLLPDENGKTLWDGYAEKTTVLVDTRLKELALARSKEIGVPLDVLVNIILENHLSEGAS